MDGPESRWKCAQLNSFDATPFDKRDGILEVVVRILCAVRREDATRRHRFTVNRFDDSEFVGADLN